MRQPEFYLVWREGSGPTTPTYKHPSYHSAKTECERLTRQQGGKFYVLQHIATAEKQDVIFTEVEHEIPF